MEINNLAKPWLSVIIPLYNAEKYIRKCIESVLMQSFKDFELIIVDDGSSDASGEICKEYAEKDPRIKYIYKKNGGSIQARVFGVEQSAGDYFTFCDADDYYASGNVFEIMHREIMEKNVQVLQFCYKKKFNHLTSSVDLSDRKYAKQKDYYEHEYPKLLCSFWPGAHLTTNVWNKVYSKQLKTNLPSYDSFERIFWGDDLIMNLYLLENCRSILFIPDHLYIYRLFSGGTNRFNTRTMHDLDKIKEYQLKFIDRYQGNEKDKITGICFSEIAGWFFAYIKQGVSIVGDQETKELIEESLELCSFKKARKFYSDNPQITDDAVLLLKKADSEEYIDRAKKESSRKSIKNEFMAILKKIYKSI